MLGKVPGVAPFDPLDPYTRSRVVNGVWMLEALSIPANAWVPVSQRLSSWGVPYHAQWVPSVALDLTGVPTVPWEIPTMRPPLSAVERNPDTHGWTPFQVANFTRHRSWRGGIAEWDGGTGKTVMGITWAEAFATAVPEGTPRRKVVVVTRSSTRWQWRASWVGPADTPEDRRAFWTTVDPSEVKVLEGHGDWTVHKTHPDKIEDGCPPFWVGGAHFDGAAAWFDTKEAAQAEALRRRTMLSIDPAVSVIIASWEILAERAEALSAWGPALVIFDESHRARNHKRWKQIIQPDGRRISEPRYNTSWAAYHIAERIPASGGVLLLSGTPQYTFTRDWWAQLTLYDPKGWDTLRPFAEAYCAGRQDTYNYYSEGSSNPEELRARIDTMRTRVTSAEAQQYLPPMHFTFTRLPANELASVRVTRADATKARKAGPSAVLELRLCLSAESKVPYILQRVEAAFLEGKKVLILTGRIEGCERLGKALDALVEKVNGPKWLDRDGETHAPLDARCWWGHGGFPDEQLYTMITAYRNTRGPAVLLGTIDAWGEAVDGMQDTDLALYPYFPWEPGKLEQAIWRPNRLGRQRSLEIEFIEALNSVDAVVLERLDQRLLSSEALGHSSAGTLRNAFHTPLDEEKELQDLAAALLARADERAAQAAEDGTDE
jgi:hypothetical protein